MSYQINKTNGDIIAVVEPKEFNEDLSIVILGRNYEGYGKFIAENFVRLLENSANNIAPTSPLDGELWYDTDAQLIKVYNGIKFKTLGRVSVETISPVDAVLGDFWFDTANDNLYIFNGTTNILVNVGGDLGVQLESILDITDDLHSVIKFKIGVEVVGVFNKDPEFVPKTTIPGFTTILPGLQLPTIVNGLTPLFEGAARRALNLVDPNTGLDYPAVEEISLRVNISGDTMTGSLVLAADPTLALEAATKGYVDNKLINGGVY